MWHIVVAVVVCMATIGYSGPLGDTAAPKEPVKDTLLIAHQQDTKITKAEDDSSSLSSPLQARGMLCQVAFLTYSDNSYTCFPEDLTTSS